MFENIPSSVFLNVGTPTPTLEHTGTCTSRTPQLYQHSRNAMIHQYQKDPNTYLSATQCRRMIAGDAGSLLRVHSFLERHGLINHTGLSASMKSALLSNDNDFRNYLFDLNTNKLSLQSVSADAPTKFAPSSEGRSIDVVTSSSSSNTRKWKREEIESLFKQLDTIRHEAAKSGRLVEPSWDEIAKRIGNGRTAEECEMKFLGFRSNGPRNVRSSFFFRKFMNIIHTEYSSGTSKTRRRGYERCRCKINRVFKITCHNG